jgi:hypothetical protein
MAEVHLPHAGGADHEPPHHETSDVNLRAILGFLAGLTIAAVFINFIVWLLFTYFSVREARQPAPVFPLAVQKENRLPPEPRLQAHPRDDLRDLRAREDEILTTYGWVDQSAGVVRIPIDRAMKLAVERGLPVRQDKK